MGVIKIFDDDDDDEKSYLKYLFIFKYNLRVNDKQTMMLIWQCFLLGFTQKKNKTKFLNQKTKKPIRFINIWLWWWWWKGVCNNHEKKQTKMIGNI